MLTNGKLVERVYQIYRIDKQVHRCTIALPLSLKFQRAAMRAVGNNDIKIALE